MNQVTLQVAALLLFIACLAMDFKPSTPAEIQLAIGSTGSLPENLRRALDPTEDFKAIPDPRPGDWLAVHPESGQTFDAFRKARRNTPDARRNKVYLQPLGDFPEQRSPSVEILKEYASAYFSMRLEVRSALATSYANITTRRNPISGNRQILTTDVLDLLRRVIPEDGFCLLGITMEDLYPAPSWNFVFGQASFLERIGVFSFARYDPAFYGERRGADYQKTLLRRSCKVLVHETAHMFSLQHCIFFKCVLNGSNHLDESDSRPLSLCPVCLRKLQYAIGFDVVDRYRNLLRLYHKLGFDKEAKWVNQRLARILGD